MLVNKIGNPASSVNKCLSCTQTPSLKSGHGTTHNHGMCVYYSCLFPAEESVLPERCTTPVWEEPDEPAARSFDSGTYEHPTPPSPPHSSEHTITTFSLSTMTSLSDYSSASSNQDSGSELSSPTEVSSHFKVCLYPSLIPMCFRCSVKYRAMVPLPFFYF